MGQCGGQIVREWVLATWPDGGRLSRIPEMEDDQDSSDPDVILAYWKGDEYVTKLDLFHVRSADESHGTGELRIEWDVMVSGIEAKARICWFLFETTAPSYFRERMVDNDTLLDFLYLPQFLPDKFVVLDEHYLEVLFLLGEVVPCWWKTKSFETWARTTGLPTGLDPSRGRRW